MKKIVWLLFILSISSCAGKDKQKISQNKLYYTSGLKFTVAQGDGRANYQIYKSDLSSGLYMVGPEENFQGEVTIFEGKVFNTRYTDGKLTTHHEPVKMVFNVYAKCLTFEKLDQQKVKDIQDLENFLAKNAKGKNIFKIVGEASSLKSHVVTGLDSMTQRPAKKILEKKSEPIKIIGFYSTEHRRLFTHHDRDTHMHIIDREGHTSHLDDFKDLKISSLDVCELN